MESNFACEAGPGDFGVWVCRTESRLNDVAVTGVGSVVGLKSPSIVGTDVACCN